MGNEVMDEIKKIRPKYVKFQYKDQNDQIVERTMVGRYLDPIDSIIMITMLHSNKVKCLRANNFGQINFKPMFKPQYQVIGEVKIVEHSPENDQLFKDLLSTGQLKKDHFEDPQYIVLMVEPTKIIKDDKVIFTK